MFFYFFIIFIIFIIFYTIWGWGVGVHPVFIEKTELEKEKFLSLFKNKLKLLCQI